MLAKSRIDESRDHVGVLGGRQGLVDLVRAPLFSNALYLWAYMCVTLASGFAFWALVATFYSTSDVGRGSAGLSAMMLLAMLSQLGLGFGLVRFLPQAGDDAPALINSSLSVAALISISTSCVFLFGLSFWLPELGFLRSHPLYPAAFVVFTVSSALLAIQDQTFVALRRAKYVFLRGLLVNLVRVLLAVALGVLGGAFGIIAAMGMASLLGVAAGTILLARAQHAYVPALVFRGDLIRRVLPFSVGTYAADLALAAPGLLLPLVVLHLLDADRAGYFYVGWFAGYVLSGVSFFMAVSLFAEGTHDEAALPMITRKALTIALALVGVGAILVLIIGDQLLLVFGADYSREASGLMRLVAIAALPAAVTNIYLGVLRVRKAIKSLIAISGVVTLVTLGGSYLFLPIVGIAGGGLGLLLGQGVGACLSVSGLLAVMRRGREAFSEGTLVGTPTSSRGSLTVPEGQSANPHGSPTNPATMRAWLRGLLPPAAEPSDGRTTDGE